MKLYVKIAILSISLLVTSGAVIYYFTFSKVEGALLLANVSDDIVTDIRSMTLLVSGIVLIIAIVLSILLSKQIIKPLMNLSKAVVEYSRGNTKVQIKVEGNDEVSILGKELFNTSSTLNKRIAEQQILYRRLEEQKNELELQKEKMEDSNFQIRESISYAKRIQRSMLPDTSVLTRVLKGATIFYQPKDIVSGDFYWFERVRKGRNDYLVIACADATGHGVPGAIMSIMGGNQLTNIIYYQNYLDPQKILARLDKVIKFELYREDLDDSKKEGMEIGICVINLDDYTLEFSGIGIPLYFLRDGKLETYKAIRDMVGGMDGEEREVESRITKEIIELKKGDRIYMSSDGLQDQFGGENDKKFMTKRLKALFEEMSQKPMGDQDKIIEDQFNSWKENRPQTDDVVVIGAEF